MGALHVLLMVLSTSLPAVVWAQERAADPWSRVVTLEPGSEILLTAARTRPAPRYVLAVDDDGLRVLNLTDSSRWQRRCDRSPRSTPSALRKRRLTARVKT